MKILLFIEYFYPHIGGVEQVVREIGKRLVKRHVGFIVFTTSQPQPNRQLKFIKKYFLGLVKEYELDSIRVVRLSLPEFLKRYLFPLIGLPLALFIFRDVDLIHSTNNYSVAVPAFLLAKILNKKVTLSVWEIWGRKWFRYFPPHLAVFYWLYEKITLRLSFDYFIVPSKFVWRQIRHIPESKKSLIFLGGKNLKFDKRARRMLRHRYHLDRKFVFLYYGRLGISKGINYLINAHNQINRKFPEVLLYICSPDIKRFVGFPGFRKNGNIRLKPAIPASRLAKHLSMADCLVIPDVSASFGLSALEVSQMGLPLVTTTAGALPEVAFGKVIFVKPGSVNSLARGLIKAYQGKYQKIAKKHFSWSQTARDYQAVFQRLIQAG